MSPVDRDLRRLEGLFKLTVSVVLFRSVSQGYIVRHNLLEPAFMPRTPTWRTKSLSSSGGHVPASLGLYAIGHLESTLGLELAREIVYVGQSKNLRRRLGEHSHLAEANAPLASYLRQNRARVYIWYTTDVPQSKLDSFERQLINQLKPKYNRLKYTRSKED